MFDIKNILNFEDDETVQTATLSMPYAILCNSNYQINYTNCRLDLKLNDVAASYTFPYGNYAVDTFMQTFKTLLPSSFNITFDTVSGCFTITNTSAQFVLLDTSTIDYVMGFSKTITSTLSGIIYTATMPRVANFLPNPLFRVCIESNTLYNGQVLGSHGSPQYSNVLASIPNVSKQNTQVVYQNFSDEFAIQPTGQTQLILSILDSEGNYIDFNGVSSYFQLRIRLYKKIKKINKSFNELATNAVSARRDLEEKGESIELPLDRFFNRPNPHE